ncbi:MAG: hypothetical protein WCR52_09030 [Bacteroidota bacterium]
MIQSAFTQTITASNDTIYPARFKGGYLLGLQLAKPNSDVQFLDFKPHFGYYIQWDLNKQNSLETEALVRWKGHYNLQVEKTEVTQDEQGRPGTSNWFCSIRNIIFLEFPVLFQHRVSGQKLTWFTGLKPAFLVPLGPIGYGTSGYHSSQEKIKNYSLQDGLSGFDLGLTAGLRIHIAPRFQLDLRCNYGMISLSDKAFFNQQTTHRNTDLQISMRRYFYNVKPD